MVRWCMTTSVVQSLPWEQGPESCLCNAYISWLMDLLVLVIFLVSEVKIFRKHHFPFSWTCTAVANTAACWHQKNTTFFFYSLNGKYVWFLRSHFEVAVVYRWLNLITVIVRAVLLQLCAGHHESLSKNIPYFQTLLKRDHPPTPLNVLCSIIGNSPSVKQPCCGCFGWIFWCLLSYVACSQARAGERRAGCPQGASAWPVMGMGIDLSRADTQAMQWLLSPQTFSWGHAGVRECLRCSWLSAQPCSCLGPRVLVQSCTSLLSLQHFSMQVNAL